jgi:hypothetical protein
VNGRTDDVSSQTGFAGHTDWRLPTIVELQTIVDLGATGCNTGTGPFDPGPPCIDPVFAPTASFLYWSSTSGTLPVDAGAVSFGFGNAGFVNKFNNGAWVRAVRTGP